MPRVKLVINRDADGFPTTVNAEGLKVIYDPDGNVTLDGPRRAWKPEVLEALKYVYPYTRQANLVLPEPLAVNVVQGGKVLLFDDMENLLKWFPATGAVALDNAFAYNGDQSLLITCGAGIADAVARRYFPMCPSKRIEVSAIICIEDRNDLDYLTMTVHNRNGVTRQDASIVYDRGTGWWGTGIAGQQHALPVIEQYANVSGSWHKIGFAVDFAAGQMLNYFVDERLFTGPYALAAAAVDANPFCAYLDFDVNNSVGNEANVWVDDVKVQEYS